MCMCVFVTFYNKKVEIAKWVIGQQIYAALNTIDAWIAW